MLLMEVSCSVPQLVKRLLHVSNRLHLVEGSHLPLKQLLLIVDSLSVGGCGKSNNKSNALKKKDLDVNY